ncbi:hypothetical protein CRG98_030485 [Punica granatum]|uniref:Uncharacterized protein n=1 Tax=Punica granatum TaxID=22663 RepID=A0A2I0IYQ4_PUNGR|nr:hypothetical protein CRG98_030485 [Punica granatum]
MEINRHCTAQSHSDCALLSSLHLQSSDSEQEARHPFPAHMAECGCEYSCQTAVQTLDWIQAIVRFIEPYIFLMEAHVVNFFKGHWPASLKKFVHTLRCLSFPRDQADLQTMFPGLHADSLSSVLIQGMSMKKKHEVEVLSAIVSFIAKRVGAHTIIDVGAGQVLLSHYPEVMVTSPSIGRQGKAMRRQQQRRILESSLNQESSCRVGSDFDSNGSCNNRSTICERAPSGTNYSNFEEFSLSGLQRLGLQPLQDMDLHWIWKEHEPFMEFIGPYWSLRAAIGGVLETLILLDRLLFLQEQGIPLKAFMLPIFDPSLSPRNVAIVAMKI